MILSWDRWVEAGLGLDPYSKKLPSLSIGIGRHVSAFKKK
jgi:hypothetical protein